MKLIVMALIAILYSSTLFAFDPGVPQTFDQLCSKDSTGFPADPDVVNCWGFETENELYYHNHSFFSTNIACSNDDFLTNHVNGRVNYTPVQNTSINISTCRYPKRDATFSTSGTHSLKIVQIDDTSNQANSGGTFAPYFKHYVDSNGNRKFAGFGAGGEFWVHWRYRQDDGLFNYSAKRFMVTHEQSYFEQVLVAFDASGLTNTPPFRYVCAYSNKGNGPDHQWYGCSNTKFYESNKWHTFVMHVKVADSTADSFGYCNKNGVEGWQYGCPDGRPDLDNGTVEIFMDGELILSSYNSPMRDLDLWEPYSEDLDWDTQHAMNAYFRLDFLLFENDKTYSGRQPGAMWIDDVIISKKELPTILAGGVNDNVAPAAPQNLNVN